MKRSTNFRGRAGKNLTTDNVAALFDRFSVDQGASCAHTSTIEMAKREPPPLSEDDLETILIVARNGQSGRITEFEIKALVAAYRKHYKLS